MIKIKPIFDCTPIFGLYMSENFSSIALKNIKYMVYVFSIFSKGNEKSNQLCVKLGRNGTVALVRTAVHQG